MSATSNTKKAKKQFDWAFDCTTQFTFSDEDSEPDDQELPTTNPRAGELRIDDLDLSTREDHVSYKPNPFSIAKINAAYRPSTVNDPAPSLQRLPPAQPARPINKLTQTGHATKRSCTDSKQTTIMEGFKTQAMKKPSTNALQLQVPPHNPIPVNANLAVKRPVTPNPDVSVASTLPMPTSLSTPAVLTLPCSISTTAIPNASDFPHASSPQSEYAHILTPKASQRRDTQSLSKNSQSHGFALAKPLSDILHNHRNRTNNRGPVFSSLSSPGRLHNDDAVGYDPRTRFAQTYSSPTRPRPYSPADRPFPGQIPEKGSVPPFIKPFGPKRASMRGRALELSFPINKTEDHYDHFEDVKPDGGYVVQENEASVFLRLSSNLPSTSELRHQAQSLNKRQYIQAPPASLLPSASFISSPSNYLSKKRIHDDSSSSVMQAKSYPKHGACQFPNEDPDEEWTTLPSKKRKRKPKTVLPGDPNYTKSFRIPGLRLPTMKAENITAPPARRMKIYLPPPLNSVDVKSPTSNKDFDGLGKKATEDKQLVYPSSPTNFDANAYPSPSTSNSKPPLTLISQAKRGHNYTPPRFRPGVRAVSPYRPLSPPTSDLPIPSDADIHVKVDHERIKLGYPKMRLLSRKRRRASADVWDLLELDSCGYVWKDIEGGGQDEQTEIQIVVWPPT